MPEEEKGWNKWNLESGKFYGLPCDYVFQAFKEALNERLAFYSRYTTTPISWNYGEIKHDIAYTMNYIDGTLDSLITGFILADNSITQSYNGLSYFSVYSFEPLSNNYLWKFLNENRIDSRQMNGMEFTAFLPWCEQVFKVINLLQTVYARPINYSGTFHSLNGIYKHIGGGVIVFDKWSDLPEDGGYVSDINYAFYQIQSYQAYGGDTSPEWYYDGAWHSHNVPAGLHQYVTDFEITGDKIFTNYNGSYTALNLVEGQKLKYKIAELSYVWQPMEVYLHSFEPQNTNWLENQVVTVAEGETSYNGTALSINIGTLGNATFRPAPATNPAPDRFSFNGSLTDFFVNISPVFEYRN